MHRSGFAKTVFICPSRRLSIIIPGMQSSYQMPGPRMPKRRPPGRLLDSVFMRGGRASFASMAQPFRAYVAPWRNCFAIESAFRSTRPRSRLLLHGCKLEDPLNRDT